MRDFERIEQAIAAQEQELQKLESEIEERRRLLGRQKEALSLLQPLLVSVLGESTKVVTIEPDAVFNIGIGHIFQDGTKERRL
jgi:uncharacterized coiled-coil protein SlyX